MPAEFDPYYKWLGIPPKDQPPHHYRLLGVELFEADSEVIDAAANRLIQYLQDMSIGAEVKHSQKLLNEIAAARRCLLNPEKKRVYDEALRAKCDLVSRGAAPPARATPPNITPLPPPAPVQTSSRVSQPPPVPGPGPDRTNRLHDSAVMNAGDAQSHQAESSNTLSLSKETVRLHVAPASVHPKSYGSHASRATAATSAQVSAGVPDVARQRRLIWIVAGGAACVLAVGFVSMLYSTASPSGNTVDKTKRVGGAASRLAVLEPPRLVIEVPAEQRDGLEIAIDEAIQAIPTTGPWEFSLQAGRRTVRLRRAGFDDFEQTFVLVDGQRRELTIALKPVAPPANPPAVTAGESKPATNPPAKPATPPNAVATNTSKSSANTAKPTPPTTTAKPATPPTTAATKPASKPQPTSPDKPASTPAPTPPENPLAKWPAIVAVPRTSEASSPRGENSFPIGPPLQLDAPEKFDLQLLGVANARTRYELTSEHQPEERRWLARYVVQERLTPIARYRLCRAVPDAGAKAWQLHFDWLPEAEANLADRLLNFPLRVRVADHTKVTLQRSHITVPSLRLLGSIGETFARQTLPALPVEPAPRLEILRIRGLPENPPVPAAIELNGNAPIVLGKFTPGSDVAAMARVYFTKPGGNEFLIEAKTFDGPKTSKQNQLTLEGIEQAITRLQDFAKENDPSNRPFRSEDARKLAMEEFAKANEGIQSQIAALNRFKNAATTARIDYAVFLEIDGQKVYLIKSAGD